MAYLLVKEIRKSRRYRLLFPQLRRRIGLYQNLWRLGADDYSLKPIKAVDLISRIKVHLQYHEKSQYYENYDKGISTATLQKIEEQMQKITEFMDIDMLEEVTQIKKKTLYRYPSIWRREGRIRRVSILHGDMGRAQNPVYSGNNSKNNRENAAHIPRAAIKKR